jgi:hypothetical protein
MPQLRGNEPILGLNMLQKQNFPLIEHKLTDLKPFSILTFIRAQILQILSLLFRSGFFSSAQSFIGQVEYYTSERQIYTQSFHKFRMNLCTKLHLP